MSDRQKILEYLERVAAAAAEAEAAATQKRRIPRQVYRPPSDIAVIGMACRFPGGINTSEELWRFVASGGRITASLPGLDDPDEQRQLLLDVCEDAVVAARIDPATLLGSRTGVFVECSPEHLADDPLAAGRLAYQLSLIGPTVAVDLAEAAPLVALHQAISGLQQNTCTLALAAACAVNTARGAAPATGSAGVAAVLLERLSDAQRHQRRILAVIRGSAMEHDSTGAGQDGPNGTTQRRAIRQALREARLTPDLVDAVEAHAASSVLGNQVEAQALITVYGKGRTRANPMWLGSVASNLGNAGAVSGMAGVLKAVHALHHGVLPSSTALEPVVEQISWGSGGVRPLTGNLLWPVTGLARRIGVCGSGASGTSVHVLLEAPR